MPQVRPPGQRLLVLDLVEAMLLAQGLGLGLAQAIGVAAEALQQVRGIVVGRGHQGVRQAGRYVAADAGVAEAFQQGQAAKVPGEVPGPQEAGEKLFEQGEVHGVSPNSRRRETHSQVGLAGRANRRSRSVAMRQASPTVAVSMRRTSGTGPEGHDREAAARCYGETTAQKAGALSCREGAGYRNRPTTVARTSTHCGSPLDGKRAQLTPRFLQSKSTARRWRGN